MLFSACLISIFSFLPLLLTFRPRQMRLPLRSSVIFRSLLSQRRTTHPLGRRGLSGAAMRLVQFRRRGDAGGIRVGVERGEGLGVVDLKAFDPSMPSTVRELLELGDEGLQSARRYQTHSVTSLIMLFSHLLNITFWINHRHGYHNLFKSRFSLINVIS